MAGAGRQQLDRRASTAPESSSRCREPMRPGCDGLGHVRRTNLTGPFAGFHITPAALETALALAATARTQYELLAGGVGPGSLQPVGMAVYSPDAARRVEFALRLGRSLGVPCHVEDGSRLGSLRQLLAACREAYRAAWQSGGYRGGEWPHPSDLDGVERFVAPPMVVLIDHFPWVSDSAQQALLKLRVGRDTGVVDDAVEYDLGGVCFLLGIPAPAMLRDGFRAVFTPVHLDGPVQEPINDPRPDLPAPAVPVDPAYLKDEQLLGLLAEREREVLALRGECRRRGLTSGSGRGVGGEPTDALAALEWRTRRWLARAVTAIQTRVFRRNPRQRLRSLLHDSLLDPSIWSRRGPGLVECVLRECRVEVLVQDQRAAGVRVDGEAVTAELVGGEGRRAVVLRAASDLLLRLREYEAELLAAGALARAGEVAGP